MYNVILNIGFIMALILAMFIQFAWHMLLGEDTKQGDSILEVAIIINQLAIPPYREELNSDYIEEVRKTLTTWKRPKPQKWKEGDIFSIPLSDGSFGYGQVLWHQNKKSTVTCAIFGCQGNGNMPIDTVVQSPVISAMTVKNLFDLNSGKWKVEGTHSLVLEKSNVPWEHSGATGVDSKVYQEQTLTEFLEAYFALKPWNAWLTDKFFDLFLLPGVNRPTNSIVLTREQKKEYRVSLGFKTQ